MYVGVNLDPKVTGGAGKNLMLDPNIRLAISLAMNRDGLIRSTLQGYGQVANQIGVPSMNGYLSDLKPDPYDPERARQLLAAAGYPAGFTTSLLCPNGRYIADALVCQAVGQMLARVGIKASVEAVPAAVFFSRVRTGANPAPLFLSAWSNVIGDAGYTLNNMFHTVDPKRKMGSTNRSGLSDPDLDKEIDAALTEHDPDKRLSLLQAAERRSVDLHVLLPLFTAPVVLASKAGIAYDVGDSGSSEMTSAMRAHPVPQ
jgi:peptide/nickel transport system substrate-binding protein